MINVNIYLISCIVHKCKNKCILLTTVFSIFLCFISYRLDTLLARVAPHFHLSVPIFLSSNHKRRYNTYRIIRDYDRLSALLVNIESSNKGLRL